MGNNLKSDNLIILPVVGGIYMGCYINGLTHRKLNLRYLYLYLSQRPYDHRIQELISLC